jgi:hypothetical protein
LRVETKLMQRIIALIDAIFATNNIDLQRIGRIFVANYATNEGIHPSISRLAQLFMEA